MKTPLPHRILFLTSALTLFASVAFAQGGSGALPGTAPGTKPTPAPRTTAPRPAPKAPVTPTLVFNTAVKGKLDPKTALKEATGGLADEYILNARADDWLIFGLQTDDPNLGIKIFDKDRAEVAVARDPGVGGFKVKSQTGGLPADGEYRLRVVGATPATPYTLKVTRRGLIYTVYDERFTKIYSSIKEDDPATSEAAILQLEALAKDDDYRPSTYEQLGLLYLYHRHDLEKAEAAMRRAIELNGAAVVKISFDSQWRRLGRLRSGKIDWEDARTGWLRIRPGQLRLTDTASRDLASLDGARIQEIGNLTAENYSLITLKAEGAPRPFLFAPGSREKAEADLIVKLIQTHVMKK